jgi:hypothetical protein
VIAAVGIKRLGIAVLALAAAGVFALVILPFLMPADAVRDAVKADPRRHRARSGASAPHLGIAVPDRHRELRGREPRRQPHRRALRADRAGGRAAAFFPSWPGGSRSRTCSLVRLTIAIIFSDWQLNWSGHIETRAKPQAVPARTAFSEIRIEDGTIILRRGA